MCEKGQALSSSIFACFFQSFLFYLSNWPASRPSRPVSAKSYAGQAQAPQPVRHSSEGATAGDERKDAFTPELAEGLGVGWCARKESNPQPADPKSDALSN